MKRSWGRWGLLVLGVTVVWACGGGGDGGSAPASPIGGTITTDNFVIPAGESRILNADLVVKASASIKIDGTLQVPPGYSFALFSDGPTSISGDIVAIDAQRSNRATGDGGGGAVDGSNVTLSGQISLHNGQGFNLTASGPAGKLTINGSIRAGYGTPGDEASPGGNGGSIEVGTTAAINYANGLGRTNSQAFQEIEVNAGAVLTAGLGGVGGEDPVGSDQGTTLFGTGTAGGNGGSVRLACPGKLVFNGKAQAGDGGPGGGTGVAFPSGKDGVAPGAKGEGVSITTGAGGGGGSVTLAGNPVSGTGKKYRGLGVYGGGAYATPGAGGPGGNGGDVTILVGSKGADGVGDPVARQPGKPWFTLMDGAGGDGLLPGTPGGDGSKAVFRQAGGGVPAIFAINADGFGNGGRGASGCLEIPFSAGGKGGNATAIDTGGSTVVPLLTNSLIGGDGGSGNPGGDGGTGPGGHGVQGVPCNQTELYVVLDYALGGLAVQQAVPVSWFENVHVAFPEFPVTETQGCASYHLHGNQGAQVFVTDKSASPPVRYGPFNDPNHLKCGFGRVVVRDKRPLPPNLQASLDPGQSCCGQ